MDKICFIAGLSLQDFTAIVVSSRSLIFLLKMRSGEMVKSFLGGVKAF